LKTLLLILVTLLSIKCAYSQKINASQVPSPVKTKFQSLHPDIKTVSWTKHKKAGYEAEFKQNNNEFGVTIDSLGNLMETEMEMKISELTKEIHEYVAKNYPDYTITDAAQITFADGKPIFKVEITKGKESAELLFDSSYKFVKPFKL
jgi:hypothetical protein